MSRITVGNTIRFLNSAAAFVKSGGKLVSQEEANRRAAICATCPYNAANHRKGPGCTSCFAKRAWLFFQKKVRSDHDNELTYCKVCGCNLKLKVHFPLGSIDNKGILPEYPAHCWQLDEPNDENSP